MSYLRELVGITVVQEEDLLAIKQLAEACGEELILPVSLPGGRFGGLHLKTDYLRKL